MHPSLWNLQKILPKIVPICMPYAGQILFKDIPFFLKFTERWVVKCYPLWSNVRSHSDEIYKTGFSLGELATMNESSLKIRSDKSIGLWTWKAPFLHVTIYLHHKSSCCGVNSENREPKWSRYFPRFALSGVHLLSPVWYPLYAKCISRLIVVNFNDRFHMFKLNLRYIFWQIMIDKRWKFHNPLKYVS